MRAQLLVLPDDSISVAAHDYAHSRRHGVMLPSLNPSTLTALIAVTARRAETRYASHQLEYQWTLGLEHVPSRRAAANVLSTVGKVVHELLNVGTDVLWFAPIPGLEEAARVLLNIWDALELVDVSQPLDVSATDRAILMSIREEIAEDGDEVGLELQPPLDRLVESYREVHRLLMRQSNQPIVKRYLQRALGGCHNSLADYSSMFNTSIQIRILKQSPDLSHLALDSSPTGGLLLTAEPAPLDGPVLAQLQAVTARQNERDTVHDAADLRQLMRTALQANSDVEMIRVLQVGRDEMPEAIKTLQRALEKEVERERTLVEQEEAVFSTAQGFIETGIDALRRLSGAGAAALPSWTITRYEMNRDEKIGLGFFLDV
ncbi:hypothetical protein C8Q76DRAFT_697968 [Earliella scabrosa]|nr:hypothetical protein C8Q76DRAFT_697968 [Earliella scabrosa]